ncbi:MAG: prolipoprotein diacylglyceryl transferase [Phycisphaerales bacterium]
MHIPWYMLLMALGLGFSAWVWSGRFKHRPEMVIVYAAGLLGALIGAKLGYIVAELPYYRHDPAFWQYALVGRTIIGALLGGYIGVEVGKKLAGYTEPTGDVFALAVPVGIALGRIGCLLHGCCQGIICREPWWWTATGPDGLPRWPAPMIEFTFNILAALILLVLYRKRCFRGQLFHLYLIAYALFRIAHEPMRDTPRLPAGVSTYQVLVAVLLLFACWRFRVRQQASSNRTLPAGLESGIMNADARDS